MKLYGAKEAPNPRRVTIYLAEKELAIERVDFAPPYRESKTPEFLAKNPAGRIPVLELDDGTAISESAAIVEYLEELYPEPPMLGTTPVERAQVRALERIGADLFVRLGLCVQHSSPAFMASRGLALYPDVVKATQPGAERMLKALEVQIGSHPFLAGARPTVADCTLYALLCACITAFDYSLPDSCPKLRQWYQRFSERPSAAV